MTDKERFEWARDKIVGTEREKQGIGTLSEKTVHAVLKNFYAPDEDMHEIPIEGCVADIYTGTEIVEIQTRNFDRMRDKLGKFLPLYPVTIVYPIPYEKWLIWIDEETGEFSSRRKSPVKGNPYVAFKELYRIKNFLLDENLHLKFVFINMEEYRLLNGWSRDRKKGSSRFDRIPLELVEIMDIDCPRDYLQLVPYGIPSHFTVKEFAKEVHIRASLAQVVLQILAYAGVVERVGKKGNAYLYKVLEGDE